jgi:hypothetical protein
VDPKPVSDAKDSRVSPARGQVIAAHHHTLIVERGVSFVAFDAAGRPLRTAYASNIFAPQPRYLIRRP